MFAPNYATAPGEFLQEWVEIHGKTQQEVADLLGCSRKQVNEIINGRAPITGDTAVRLERVVGIPAVAWLKYEAQYRADLARIADQENLSEHFDDIAPSALAYLRTIGVTNATKREPGQAVSDFLSFHGCGTWDSYLHLQEDASKGDYALAALKESNAAIDPTVLSSWLRAAEQQEAFEQGRNYTHDAELLRGALPTLRERVATPDASMIEDITLMLADVGVVYMVVEPPKKFPLLGMTRWIDKRVPVIQQTGRWGKDGFAIWTLFHELGHVLNDPRGEMHMEFTTEKKRNSAAEKSANKFALDILFGEAGIEPFRNLRRDAEIIEAAEAAGLAPGVVVHQLHRGRHLPYSFGNKLFVSL